MTTKATPLANHNHVATSAVEYTSPNISHTHNSKQTKNKGKKTL